jgi:hypothetical protein
MPGTARSSALAFSPAKARTARGIQRLVFRYQGYLVIPMLFLEALSLHASSIRRMTGPGCRHRAWEAALLGAHFAGCLGAVFFVLPHYQIEHLLFPSMPRPNLRRAQAIVAAFCTDRGVTYTRTSLLASHAQALAHLAAIGSDLASPAPVIGTNPVPARR